jgi:hypothetical protein
MKIKILKRYKMEDVAPIEGTADGEIVLSNE